MSLAFDASVGGASSINIETGPSFESGADGQINLADGSVITKYGIYREVTPHERLAFTYNTDYATGTIDPETLVTVDLAELPDGRTRLTLTHSGFWDEASRVSHTGGWSGALDRLLDFTLA